MAIGNIHFRPPRMTGIDPLHEVVIDRASEQVVGGVTSFDSCHPSQPLRRRLQSAHRRQGSSLFPRNEAMHLNFLQWPAMVITIAAAWGAGSHRKRRRRIGFWLFLLSNVLWTIWGVYAEAWALVVLQISLAIMNVRGARNNESESQS